MPTPTLEEYLEAIFKLAGKGPVRPARIAEVMQVSAPTVTATLQRLASRGLIMRDGTSVVLTEEGENEALTIVRKHRIAERFLVDVLGLDWESAHEDACLLEHAFSDRVVEGLERLLGDPTVCPHGHPIPGADGTIAADRGRRLDRLAVGESGVVTCVSESEGRLGYLVSLGIVPGAVVKVEGVEPFGGPLSVLVDGEKRALAAEVAALVLVDE